MLIDDRTLYSLLTHKQNLHGQTPQPAAPTQETLYPCLQVRVCMGKGTG